ncbi:DUF397 domain-containing protein [Streptomyces sp. 21So2-11]|uniref:DUF397 domain-containing protein n=1 Tax=Streptomyces sp. 21So2-11 TaxID=3144408 RepID=UPI00321AE6FE
METFDFVKSSHSGGGPEQECVEVALNIPRTVAVRDSKDRSGPLIHFAPAVWSVFQRHIALTPVRG